MIAITIGRLPLPTQRMIMRCQPGGTVRINMFAMQTAIFLTRPARIRRAANHFFFAASAVAILALIPAFTPAPRVSATLAAAVFTIGAVVAGGARLLFANASKLELDLQARKYRVVDSEGANPWHPIEKLGPLHVEYRSRVVKSKQGRRTIVEYAVIPKGRPDLDLYLEKSPRRARRLLERLAKEWQLPSRSFGGDLRQPEDLDRPLHERLSRSAVARARKTLNPRWGVSVELQDEAKTVFRSSFRDLGRTFGGPLLTVAPAAFVIIAITFGGWRQLARTGYLSSMDRVFLVALGMAFLLIAWFVAKAARDAFFPGAIEVSPEGVRHRGRFLALREIEEVVSEAGLEIIADRRSIKLPLTWCPDEAFDTVAHEVRRAIIEAGKRTASEPAI